MLDGSLCLHEQKKRDTSVLGSSGHLLHELVVAPVLSPLKIPEASIRNVVEVVREGVALCSQTILGPVSLGIKGSSPNGELPVEVGLGKSCVRCPLLRNTQHAA